METIYLLGTFPSQILMFQQVLNTKFIKDLEWTYRKKKNPLHQIQLREDFASTEIRGDRHEGFIPTLTLLSNTSLTRDMPRTRTKHIALETKHTAVCNQRRKERCLLYRAGLNYTYKTVLLKYNAATEQRKYFCYFVYTGTAFTYI